MIESRVSGNPCVIIGVPTSNGRKVGTLIKRNEEGSTWEMPRDGKN